MIHRSALWIPILISAQETSLLAEQRQELVVFEEPKGDESLKLLHYENVLLDDEPDFEVVIK